MRFATNRPSSLSEVARKTLIFSPSALDVQTSFGIWSRLLAMTELAAFTMCEVER